MPEGSWKCEKCNNINYPFRTKCNRQNCGAERPSEANEAHVVTSDEDEQVCHFVRVFFRHLVLNFLSRRLYIFFTVILFKPLMELLASLSLSFNNIVHPSSCIAWYVNMLMLQWVLKTNCLGREGSVQFSRHRRHMSQRSVRPSVRLLSSCLWQSSCFSTFLSFEIVSLSIHKRCIVH